MLMENYLNTNDLFKDYDEILDKTREESIYSYNEKRKIYHNDSIFTDLQEFNEFLFFIINLYLL